MGIRTRPKQRCVYGGADCAQRQRSDGKAPMRIERPHASRKSIGMVSPSVLSKTVSAEKGAQRAGLKPVTNGDSDPSLTMRTVRNPARLSAETTMDGLADVSRCFSERSSRAAPLA